MARQAGWLFREAKEQEPSTCIRFRGYNLNTASMKFEVTEDKLKLVLKKVIVLLEAKAKEAVRPEAGQRDPLAAPAPGQLLKCLR